MRTIASGSRLPSRRMTVPMSALYASPWLTCAQCAMSAVESA